MRANLVNLQQTSNLMEATQKRLASGKRVNSALDDPISYFTALAHENRALDLSTRKDEMAESIQTIKAADTGIEAITNLIASAKSLANSALSAETTADIDALEAQYDEILNQINLAKDDSNYKGVNLLGGTDVSFDVKFDETGDSKLTIAGFDASWDGATLNLQDTTALGWNAADGSEGPESANIDTAMSALDDATRVLRSEAGKLATNLNIITTRQEFTQNMINTLKDGAGNLTNADMNEEGANMLMLQTRQALGSTSLSLASQAAQSVLRLF
jgi:flagellin-like hook-associated protein FlgL